MILKTQGFQKLYYDSFRNQRKLKVEEELTRQTLYELLTARYRLHCNKTGTTYGGRQWRQRLGLL